MTHIPGKVHYDGVQLDLMGGGVHCFTITDPASPAQGASFCLDADMPGERDILAAVARKEHEFSSGGAPSRHGTASGCPGPHPQPVNYLAANARRVGRHPLEKLSP